MIVHDLLDLLAIIDVPQAGKGSPHGMRRRFLCRIPRNARRAPSGFGYVQVARSSQLQQSPAYSLTSNPGGLPDGRFQEATFSGGTNPKGGSQNPIELFAFENGRPGRLG